MLPNFIALQFKNLKTNPQFKMKIISKFITAWIKL